MCQQAIGEEIVTSDAHLSEKATLCSDSSHARCLRIGLLTNSRLRPTSMSGVPFQMKRALEARGCTVIPISEVAPTANSPITRRVLRLFAAIRKHLTVNDDSAPTRPTIQQHINDLRSRAERLAGSIERHRPDVLFGHCISASLYGLTTDVPIVYGTDMTAALALATYPGRRTDTPAQRELTNTIEQSAFDCAEHAVVATEWARRSAINDYLVPPERIHAVPLAANVVPDDPDDIRPTPPNHPDLHLCIIAADARRKRLDFTIDIVEALNAMGWRARLTHIGRPTERGKRSPLVTCAGRLMLGDERHNARCRDILMSSDLFIMPSCAEAFGIAPCEAGHFALPSVVSDAGGLPEVVLDNETGLVLPVDAPAEAYATAIDELARDQDRYLRLADAALHRARTVYDWIAWADRILPILRDAAAQNNDASDAAVRQAAVTTPTANNRRAS